jgi:uncharacterized protein YacL
MVKKIARVLIGLFGMLLGYLAYTGFKGLELVNVTGMAELVAIIIFISIFGIIFFIFSSKIIKRGQNIAKVIEGELQRFSIQNIALGAIGLIIGLVISAESTALQTGNTLCGSGCINNSIWFAWLPGGDHTQQEY